MFNSTTFTPQNRRLLNLIPFRSLGFFNSELLQCFPVEYFKYFNIKGFKIKGSSPCKKHCRRIPANSSEKRSTLTWLFTGLSHGSHQPHGPGAKSWKMNPGERIQDLLIDWGVTEGLQGVWDTWEEHLNIVLDLLQTVRGKKSREREGLTSLRRKQGNKSIKGASEYTGLMLHSLVSGSLPCLLAKFHFYLFSHVRNSLLCMCAHVWVCNRQKVECKQERMHTTCVYVPVCNN